MISEHEEAHFLRLIETLKLKARKNPRLPINDADNAALYLGMAQLLDDDLRRRKQGA